MESSEKLYNLLFEISNEDRHNILTSLQNSKANLTQISNILNLKLSETRRHLSRLTEVGLIERNPNGTYSLTNYGEQILSQINNIKFFTENKDYFQNHSVKQIPHEFQERLGDLSISELHTKMMSFLKEVEDIIDYANEVLWIIVDELPFTIIPSLEKAIKRGVKIQIISKKLNDSELDDLINIFSSSTVTHGILENPGVMMFSSNLKTAISFPDLTNKYTFNGFTSKNAWALNWSKELFQKSWQLRIQKKYQGIEPQREDQIHVTGQNDSKYDFRSVQDAVDNFNEVTLSGTFNFGNQGITISRDCLLRGEGNENGIPLTKVYKTGWQIPFTSEERLILIKGKDIKVTIENIHFTDFNGICIEANEGNFFSFTKNRITLETGFSRGRRHPYGDMVVGLFVGNWSEPIPSQHTFPKGIELKENYLDFATSYRRGGYLSPSDKWEDPNYVPDLHEEYYIGAGFFLFSLEGEVVIEGNIIRNMNMAGIDIQDCYESAEVSIFNNEIISDIYGSRIHWFNSDGDAAFGITVHSLFSFSDTAGYTVNIQNNMIRLSKVNYGGINICGPFNRPFNTGLQAKFLKGCVIGNNIHLDNGSVGIKLGRNDNIEIYKNEISGSAYYGIKVHGKGQPNDLMIFAEGNTISGNRLNELKIKPPDPYSSSRANGIIFSTDNGRVNTGHIWLDEFSKNNEVMIFGDEKVIDEGINNKVTYNNR